MLPRWEITNTKNLDGNKCREKNREILERSRLELEAKYAFLKEYVAFPRLKLRTERKVRK
jgi:hypothetical protein